MSFQKKALNLILIDAFGALISFVLLRFVLPKFYWFFGIPDLMLWALAIPPAFFFLFDLFVRFQFPDRIARGLRAIAVMNVLYCLASLGLAFLHAHPITKFGWGYILGEILIVLLLARWEWKTATQLH